jgi:SAM-dependent methyltransferase
VKSLTGLAYKSSGIPEAPTYDLVAGEYYDGQLHPTCADFRAASFIYLKRLFGELKPSGRIADIGCGRSLVAEFHRENLVLIDQSFEMLRQNESSYEMRNIDVEQDSIGVSEFDWIFAVLGDPYNSLNAWNNISIALKPGGQCVFIVPSSSWAQEFRRGCAEERPNFARFLTSKGESIFLRSLIVEPESQRNMVTDARLSLVSTEHVLVGDLPYVRSPKISEFLSRDQRLLDIYRAKKSNLEI